MTNVEHLFHFFNHFGFNFEINEVLQITVRSTGGALSLAVQLSDSVRDLKQKINNKTGIPIEKQQLLLDSKNFILILRYYINFAFFFKLQVRNWKIIAGFLNVKSGRIQPFIL